MWWTITVENVWYHVCCGCIDPGHRKGKCNIHNLASSAVGQPLEILFQQFCKERRAFFYQWDSFFYCRAFQTPFGKGQNFFVLWLPVVIGWFLVGWEKFLKFFYFFIFFANTFAWFAHENYSNEQSRGRDCSHLKQSHLYTPKSICHIFSFVRICFQYIISLAALGTQGPNYYYIKISVDFLYFGSW